MLDLRFGRIDPDSGDRSRRLRLRSLLVTGRRTRASGESEKREQRGESCCAKIIVTVTHGLSLLLKEQPAPTESVRVRPSRPRADPTHRS